ncbi:hypothetical protein DFO66_103411 [Brevibacterium sanguinis]|uniref:DUF6993 domain-containing protein n=2 Tax=Brevibacterium TaxID=1696 RepID=A0A366IL02_9MICO|nr:MULTISPECIES: hypothetical protein [Brevibacterium]RBP66461.1 hypothetical protein DFO66_103411 [Brevibacterium sanguinis]RBP73113.1 hypothetical protein DFO65_103411 [Brevibacterium celere]
MRLIHLPGLAALTIALSGCSLLGFGADDVPEPVRTPQPQQAEVDKVIAALEPLTGDEKAEVTTEEFFDTMIDAGYEPEQLEATLDASPLGNEVPAKMFGVRTDKGCVIGEIRKGKASAELMKPTESTGSCLFGDVDRPEGVEAPKGEERSKDGDDNGAGHLPGEDINGRTESPAPTEGGSGSDSSSGGSSGSEGDSSGEAPSLGGG